MKKISLALALTTISTSLFSMDTDMISPNNQDSIHTLLSFDELITLEREKKENAELMQAIENDIAIETGRHAAKTGALSMSDGITLKIKNCSKTPSGSSLYLTAYHDNFFPFNGINFTLYKTNILNDFELLHNLAQQLYKKSYRRISMSSFKKNNSPKILAAFIYESCNPSNSSSDMFKEKTTSIMLPFAKNVWDMPAKLPQYNH